MKVSKVYYLLIITVFCTAYAQAQTLAVSIIQQGNAHDSSYYDIAQINDNNYWSIGKYGVITNIDNEGKLSNITYPNQGVDLLCIDKFDNDKIILTGDKGYIYTYNKTSGTWQTNQLKEFKKFCFYGLCIVNQSVAYICGGKSKIAQSKKAIPEGFILKTTDGGKTWAKVYSNKFNMIWNMYYSSEKNKLYALLYSPNKSKVICTDNEGASWSSLNTNLRGLYHDFTITDKEQFMGVGGGSSNIKKTGLILNQSNDNVSVAFKNAGGLFWDYYSTPSFKLIAGSKGYLVYKGAEGNWQQTKATLADNNLYEIKFIDDNTAYVVGSNKTILRVNYR